MLKYTQFLCDVLMQAFDNFCIFATRDRIVIYFCNKTFMCKDIINWENVLNIAQTNEIYSTHL